MKILFVITSFDDYFGSGGHYISCSTIAESLSTTNGVNIICVGHSFPKVFQESLLDVTSIIAGFENIYRARAELIRKISEFQPDAVISMDWKATGLVDLYCARHRIGHVVIKAGGPILKGYFPLTKYLIVFSRSDLEWFQQSHGSRLRKLRWLPNRVKAPPQDFDSIANLKQKLKINNDDLVIIRISRIIKNYLPAMQKSLAFANQLRAEGLPIRLIIIGTPVCQESVEVLRNALGPQDHLLTETEYTRNASRLLSIAHINIGIGRGFMEGCAVGQYMFAINQEAELPIPVDDLLLDKFLEQNFSTRVKFTIDPADVKSRTTAVISTITIGPSKHCGMSKNWFRRWFDVTNVYDDYLEILNDARHTRDGVSFQTLKNELSFRWYVLKQRLRRLLKSKH